MRIFLLMAFFSFDLFLYYLGFSTEKDEIIHMYCLTPADFIGPRFNLHLPLAMFISILIVPRATQSCKMSHSLCR